MQKLMRPSALCIALALAFTGCESSTGVSNAHLGTYHLVTVNGQSLPVNLGTFDGVTIDILGGHISLGAAGAATSSLTVQVTEGEESVEETDTGTGTYVRQGSSIVITWPDGTSETLQWSANELVQSGSGMVAVFRR